MKPLRFLVLLAFGLYLLGVVFLGLLLSSPSPKKSHSSLSNSLLARLKLRRIFFNSSDGLGSEGSSVRKRIRLLLSLSEAKLRGAAALLRWSIQTLFPDTANLEVKFFGTVFVLLLVILCFQYAFCSLLGLVDRFFFTTRYMEILSTGARKPTFISPIDGFYFTQSENLLTLILLPQMVFRA